MAFIRTRLNRLLGRDARDNRQQLLEEDGIFPVAKQKFGAAVAIPEGMNGLLGDLGVNAPMDFGELRIALPCPCFIRGISFTLHSADRNRTARILFSLGDANSNAGEDAGGWAEEREFFARAGDNLFPIPLTANLYTHALIRQVPGIEGNLIANLQAYGKPASPLPTDPNLFPVPLTTVASGCHVVQSTPSLGFVDNAWNLLLDEIPPLLLEQYGRAMFRTTGPDLSVSFRLGRAALITSIVIDLTELAAGEMPNGSVASISLAYSPNAIPSPSEWIMFDNVRLVRTLDNHFFALNPVREFRTTHIKVALLVHGPIHRVITNGWFVDDAIPMSYPDSLLQRGYPAPE